MKRSEAREMLFKAIYEREVQKDITKEHMDLFLENNEIMDNATIGYIKTAINSINEKEQEIEEIIAKNLKKDWSLERISKVNTALLKLAIYEINYTDTPFKVVINEVVDLAKKYSEETAPAFINGVLASVVAEK